MCPKALCACMVICARRLPPAIPAQLSHKTSKHLYCMLNSLTLLLPFGLLSNAHWTWLRALGRFLSSLKICPLQPEARVLHQQRMKEGTTAPSPSSTIASGATAAQGSRPAGGQGAGPGCGAAGPKHARRVSAAAREARTMQRLYAEARMFAVHAVR